MNDVGDLSDLEFERYAIGQPVPRSEDPVLVRGEGQYTDDVNLPRQAYCVIVRSGHARENDRGGAIVMERRALLKPVLRTSRCMVKSPRTALTW